MRRRTRLRREEEKVREQMTEQKQRRALALMREKEQMEMEMDELRKVLKPHGLTGGLVDEQGFPLDDVLHILKIREARNRLACTFSSSISGLPSNHFPQDLHL